MPTKGTREEPNSRHWGKGDEDDVNSLSVGAGRICGE